MAKVYFWYYICRAGDTQERTSPDPAGSVAWANETCVVPGCGAPIRELVLQGPDETVPGKVVVMQTAARG
jgi:hypothetical protein